MLPKESKELAPRYMGIAGCSGVFLGVGDGVAAGVGTGGVVDFFTRLPDCAKAVRVQTTINPPMANTAEVRSESACIIRFSF
jgi:hypothetical protein